MGKPPLIDDLILINTFESSAKNKHITNDKRIALSIVEQNNPFNMVSIKGKVIEKTTEGADGHLIKLAKKYLGIGKYTENQSQTNYNKDSTGKDNGIFDPFCFLFPRIFSMD